MATNYSLLYMGLPQSRIQYTPASRRRRRFRRVYDEPLGGFRNEAPNAFADAVALAASPAPEAEVECEDSVEPVSVPSPDSVGTVDDIFDDFDHYFGSAFTAVSETQSPALSSDSTIYMSSPETDVIDLTGADLSVPELEAEQGASLPLPGSPPLGSTPPLQFPPSLASPPPEDYTKPLRWAAQDPCMDYPTFNTPLPEESIFTASEPSHEPAELVIPRRSRRDGSYPARKDSNYPTPQRVSKQYKLTVWEVRVN